MKDQQQSLELEVLEDRILLSAVEIFAAGGSGQENLSLQIDGVEVATFENIGGDASDRVFQQLVYETDQDISASQIRIEFTNDLFDPATGLDRNLFVDRIVVDGETFQTEGPSVFSTGYFANGGFTGAGFLNTETLNVNGSFFFSDDNTPRDPTNESQVAFVARGTTGDEIVQLEIDGHTVATFEPGQINQQFQFKRDQPINSGTTRLVFVNDFLDTANGIDRNVILDSLEFEDLATNEIRRFDGNSSEIFSTGTFTNSDGIVDGFGRGNTLHANGFFAFPGTGSGVNQTLITAQARGTTGDEVLQLVIDGQVVQEFNVTNTGGLADFQFTADGSVSADRIQIRFVNDFFDAANNIDRNLIVETLILENLQSGGVESFATNSPSTFSTGTFTDADGVVDGFGRGNTLHANGFFQFAGVIPSGGFGLDPTFGNGGQIALNSGFFGVNELFSLPDERFAATFVTDASRDAAQLDLTFFTSDGQIDSTRGDNGEIPFFNFGGNDAVIDFDDGSLLIVQNSRSLLAEFRKFNPDGSPDTSFGDGGSISFNAGTVPVIAGTPEGGFLHATNGSIERFDRNGQRDFNFGNSGFAETGFFAGVDQLLVDDSGNIFAITDNFESTFFEDTPARIAKFTSNGQLDASFGDSGVADLSSIDTEVVLDSQGRLIFGNEFENNLFQLTRVNADGSVDPSFDALAPFSDSNVDGLLLEVDAFDRVVGVANNVVDFGFGAGDTRFEITRTIFRINNDGTLDSSFANNGTFVEQTVGPTSGTDRIEELRITDNGNLLILQSDSVLRFNV